MPFSCCWYAKKGKEGRGGGRHRSEEGGTIVLEAREYRYSMKENEI